MPYKTKYPQGREYTCSICGTNGIQTRGGCLRTICEDPACLRKYNCGRFAEYAKKRKEKVPINNYTKLPIDMIPKQELVDAYPYFYSLVRNYKNKNRRCIKCGSMFRTTPEKRICCG